jgi:Uma2 family endonuclease
MNLVNRTVIIEVLSPDTEAYDRVRRFEHYQSIDSLQEYLLVSTDRTGVTLYRRQLESEWRLITINSLDSYIDLQSVGCRLLLRDLYYKVAFPVEASSV